MRGSTKIWGWPIILICFALVAVGLVGLWLPVYLDSFDSWGIRVKCGNGYSADLVQATIDDQQPTSAAVRPAASYVNQCQSALAHRRAWLIPGRRARRPDPHSGAGGMVACPGAEFGDE